VVFDTDLGAMELAVDVAVVAGGAVGCSATLPTRDSIRVLGLKTGGFECKTECLISSKVGKGTRNRVGIASIGPASVLNRIKVGGIVLGAIRRPREMTDDTGGSIPFRCSSMETISPNIRMAQVNSSLILVS
jgi:hypothetical protein